MSCLLSKGRLLPCKDKVGGLYKVWFINYDTAIFTMDTDGYTIKDITGKTSGVTIYEYELKGTSKLTQEMVSSRENGTTYVTQTLTLDLAGGDAATNNEIKLLAYGRPHIIVQDNYGSCWLVGLLRGCDVTSAIHDTGGAIGEKYGYTITLVATENEYANFLKGSTINAPFNALVSYGVANPVIVKGS